jgi:hypothetical protein
VSSRRSAAPSPPRNRAGAAWCSSRLPPGSGDQPAQGGVRDRRRGGLHLPASLSQRARARLRLRLRAAAARARRGDALASRSRPLVRGRGRVVEASLQPDRRARRLGRQLLLDPAWPLLAAQQPRQRGPGCAIRGRSALVRYGVAAIPQLPGAAPGRPPGGCPRVRARRGQRAFRSGSAGSRTRDHAAPPSTPER